MEKSARINLLALFPREINYEQLVEREINALRLLYVNTKSML